MKRRLSVILALVLIANLCLLYLPSCTRRVIEYQFGDYRYTVETQEVTITEYSGDATDVTVPESIDGMPVVAIGRSAFHNCDKMKSLTLPDSVIKIGGLAFNKCYSLEHVTLGRGIREIDYSPFANCEKMIYNEYENGLYVGNDENPYFALVSMTSNSKKIEIHPDAIVVCGSALEYCRSLCELVFPEGVVSIGSFAMQSCLSLETVYIPKSVESIGLLAFQNCDSIQKIVVSDENPHFKSVDGSLFSRDGSRLIKYATGQNVISYRIPDSTVIIEDFAFANAKHLTEVILPDSVEKIGHSAFIHCENMQSIHLGNALKKIGGQAFGIVRHLRRLPFPTA